MPPNKPRKKAWMPADYQAQEVEALQALQRGEANEHQQRLALDWIINSAAGTYELSYRSTDDGGERETAFAEGRRYVGLSVVKMLSLSGAAIKAIR